MKIFILGITLVLFALPAFAATYTWEDERGTINFTEDLGNVPAKYRNKVKVVGEEELLPSQPEETGEHAPAKGPVKGAGGAQERETPAGKTNEKAVYGGKEMSAWKAEYGALDADVKAAEKQLVENRNRLKDTSSMSRTEYLSLLATIRAIEDTIVTRRQKLEELKQQAAEAGVPAGSME